MFSRAALRPFRHPAIILSELPVLYDVVQVVFAVHFVVMEQAVLGAVQVHLGDAFLGFGGLAQARRCGALRLERFPAGRFDISFDLRRYVGDVTVQIRHRRTPSAHCGSNPAGASQTSFDQTQPLTLTRRPTLAHTPTFTGGGGGGGGGAWKSSGSGA
jgi:hypothetical protein